MTADPRNYHAHPAFDTRGQLGLREVSSHLWPLMIPASWSELDDTWTALPEDEQDRREIKFFACLLTGFAQMGPTEFEVELPLRSERATLMERCRASEGKCADDRGAVITGVLNVDIAPLMATLNPVRLTLRIGKEDVFSLHDGWTGVLLRLPQTLTVDIERLPRGCLEKTREPGR